MGKIDDVIVQVKNCAQTVYDDLGCGWPEKIYQAAMEVELRNAGIEYENQRILPIDYQGFIVGESIPDLIVWVRDGKKRVGVVIDLKQDSAVKEDHEIQVQKYIDALKRQLRPGEKVHPAGLLICFPKSSLAKVDAERVEKIGDVNILTVGSAR